MTIWARDFKFAEAINERLYFVMVALPQKAFQHIFSWKVTYLSPQGYKGIYGYQFDPHGNANCHIDDYKSSSHIIMNTTFACASAPLICMQGDCTMVAQLHCVHTT